MSFQLTVLYHRPEDPAAFDAYYESTHVPLVTRLPGLRSFTVSRPGPGPDGQPAAEYLVAAMQWDDQAAFASRRWPPRRAGDLPGPRQLRVRRRHPPHRRGHHVRLTSSDLDLTF